MVVPIVRSPRLHAGHAGRRFSIVLLATLVLTYEIVILLLDYSNTTERSLVELAVSWPLSTITNNLLAVEVGIFGNIFKLTQRADKWSFWHAASKSAAALSRDDVSCEWTTFKPFGRPENTMQMCTYPVATDKFVSEEIKNVGHWYDCNDAVGLWKEATGHRASLASSDNTTSIYLDVGGNIGSCVMEMLQSTDAKIVVFEPHPHNLAQITTTIMGQPEEVRKRVIIFPVGVGDVTGNFTMYMSSENRGHSVVGEKVTEFPGQKFLSAAPIFVERLNDIFNLDKVVIPLLKMDIQGFECKALDGMSSLLSNVDIIMTEADGELLRRQGCTVQGMISQITNAGFHVVVNGDNIVARKNHTQS